MDKEQFDKLIAEKKDISVKKIKLYYLYSLIPFLIGVAWFSISLLTEKKLGTAQNREKQLKSAIDSIKKTHHDTVYSSAKQTDSLYDDTKFNVYDFTVKLIDTSLISKLKKVDYYCAHGFDKKLRSSSDPFHQFQVHYLGVQPMDTLTIYLHYKNSDRKHSIIFLWKKNVHLDTLESKD